MLLNHLDLSNSMPRIQSVSFWISKGPRLPPCFYSPFLMNWIKGAATFIALSTHAAAFTDLFLCALTSVVHRLHLASYFPKREYFFNELLTICCVEFHFSFVHFPNKSACVFLYLGAVSLLAQTCSGRNKLTKEVLILSLPVSLKNYKIMQIILLSQSAPTIKCPFTLI